MPSLETEITRASAALDEGRADKAGRLLARILEKHPGSAPAHNLAAIAHMQRNDPARALSHARKAVDLDPANHRYLSNLGATLMIDGQHEAALTHLDQALEGAPDYHLARRNRGMLNAGLGRFEAAVADLTVAARHEPERAETRIALADALIETGAFEKAVEELRAAEKIDGAQTAHWKYVWGRLMYRVGRFADARYAFTGALLADPRKMEHFVALAAANFHCGDLREAARATRTTFRHFPCAERRSGTPELRVLVLEDLGRSHFTDLIRGSFVFERGNFIGHMPPGRVAYTHVISDCVESIADVLDPGQFDIAYNNRVIPEITALNGQEDQLRRLVSRLPMPVLNRPEAVAETSRARNAQRFAKAEKFVLPRTLHVENGLDPAETRSRILDQLKLPIILRPLTTHVGVGAELVHDERALTEAIAKRAFSDFYAIEYHDCQSEDGLFRRYRFACISGQLCVNSMHIASQWNVHSAERSTLGWFERGFDREETAYYEAPEQVLGADPATVFDEIVKSTALDIYGFDFGFRRDGRIVVFEVNAAMALGLDVDFARYPHRKPNAERFRRKLEELLFARAGRTTGSSAGPAD